RTAPGTRVWPRLSIVRGAACAWWIRPGRQSCSSHRAPRGRADLSFLAGSCGYGLIGEGRALGGRFIIRRPAGGCARVFLAQPAQELQVGLEVDVMRQLQVLHKAGGFDVIAVIKHELV